MYMCVCIHTHTHTHTHITSCYTHYSSQQLIQTASQFHTHTHTHKQTRTHARARAHTHTHTHKHTNTPTKVKTYTSSPGVTNIIILDNGSKLPQLPPALSPHKLPPAPSPPDVILLTHTACPCTPTALSRRDLG